MAVIKYQEKENDDSKQLVIQKCKYIFKMKILYLEEYLIGI